MLQEKLLTHLRQQGLFRAYGVEDAFKNVPRHEFIPHITPSDAYADNAIPLKRDGEGIVTSSISQPTMIAIMLNQLALKPGDNVLEIGTATGYNAALMQTIVGDAGRITTVEIDADLVEMAQQNLTRMHFSRVAVVHADGAGGYAPRAAYDHILATAGTWDIPPAWVQQLKHNGTIVAPLWIDGIQLSAVLKQQPDGTLYSEDNRPCAFVRMLGENSAPRHWKQIGSTPLTLYADDVSRIDAAALNLLLSDDHSLFNLDTRLAENEYWFGFQIYLMLNLAPSYRFIVYAVPDKSQAFGLKGQGLGILAPASAAFAPYSERGVLHAFGGSDAALEFQNNMDTWNALKRPNIHQLRIRIIPRHHETPTIQRGRLYQRRHNLIHIWLETD